MGVASSPGVSTTFPTLFMSASLIPARWCCGEGFCQKGWRASIPLPSDPVSL